MKECQECHEPKDQTAFSPYRRVCKACRARYQKRRAAIVRHTPEYLAKRAAYMRTRQKSGAAKARDRRHSLRLRLKYPRKIQARELLRRALERGGITRPEACERCGTTPRQRRDGRSGLHAHHHRGYDYPLDVVWLCYPCHTAEHRALPDAPPTDRGPETGPEEA